MNLLGRIMDRLGWLVIFTAIFYFGYSIGYALVFSPALREVLK